ncbi:MAG: hypothetical protein JXJ20_12205 [Anaerolineae bacterium]|nr:hypothetical protein [Anaerolineae bacterium]
MANAIAPFHRLSNGHEVNGRYTRVLRAMRIHFTLAGLLLLVGALGLAYLHMNEFQRIGLNWNLRITRPRDIYDTSTQLKVIVMLVLGVASLIQLRTVHYLYQGEHAGVMFARLSSLMLLLGLPLSVVLWRLELDVPVIPASVIQIGLRGAAVILFVQAILALWYMVRLFSAGLRRAMVVDETAPNRLLRRVRYVVLGLWLLVLVGIGVVLAVMTDWIDLPIARPEPGDLLYATSFDALNEEWDLYPGRDSAQIASVNDLSLVTGGDDMPPVEGGTLVITYGSSETNAIVFSVLDRKFNDMDLRVAGRQVSGPVDNQYGVIFRYRNLDNYYAFLISADGYYSLVKQQNGELEVISAWGITEVIRQGEQANTIRVLAYEDEFMFFVNDQLMPLCLRGENENSMWAEWEGPGICFTDDLTYSYRDESFSQGKIALTAGSSVDLSADVVVAFDDVVITGPQPDAMQVPEE